MNKNIDYIFSKNGSPHPYILFKNNNFDPDKYISLVKPITYNEDDNAVMDYKLTLTCNKNSIDLKSTDISKHDLYHNFNDDLLVLFDEIKIDTDIIKPYNSQIHDILHFNEKLVILSSDDELKTDNSDILKNNILLFDKNCESYKPIYDLFKKVDNFIFKNLDKFLNSTLIKSLCGVDSYKLIYNDLCNSEKKFYYDTNLGKIHLYDKYFNKYNLNTEQDFNHDYLKISIDDNNFWSLKCKKKFEGISSISNKEKYTYTLIRNNNELTTILHKDVIILPIIDISNLYFTNPTRKHNPFINFGIIPVFRQILIFDP